MARNTPLIKDWFLPAMTGALGGAMMGALTVALGSHLKVSGFRNLSAAKAATLLGISALFGGVEGWVIGRYGAKPPAPAPRPLDSGLAPTLD